MNGNMWVESELGVGSKFFFTITAEMSRLTTEAVQAKMSAFAKRAILYYDTLGDRTGVVKQLEDLGLRPYIIKAVSQVSQKETCPHFDTILVDTLTAVSSPLPLSVQALKSIATRPNK